MEPTRDAAGAAAVVPKWKWAAHVVALLLIAVGLYIGISYGVAPRAWRLFEHRHPALTTAPTRTVTGSGIPGDPLNIAFVGTDLALHRAMLEAGWSPADAITMGTSLRIAAASLLHRSYDTAPVSALFVYGRVQDFAFERQAGNDPRQRHHVRFWRSPEVDGRGRPLWIGAATFDTRVGFSHTTGQVTHHIGAEIDRERDKLVDEIGKEPEIDVSWLDEFQNDHRGRNGGGDPFETDGRLAILTAPPGDSTAPVDYPSRVAK